MFLVLWSLILMVDEVWGIDFEVEVVVVIVDVVMGSLV